MNVTMIRPFLGKHITLSIIPRDPNRIDPFVIDGVVLDADEKGILFRSPQKTAYISYSDIEGVQ